MRGNDSMATKETNQYVDKHTDKLSQVRNEEVQGHQSFKLLKHEEVFQPLADWFKTNNL